MGIFDSIGDQQQQQVDMRQEIGNIKSNPGSYLKGRGFNIPDGMSDPKQITQYLLQSGQVGGNRLQQVMRMIGAIR
jgi:hypothetical protein